MKEMLYLVEETFTDRAPLSRLVALSLSELQEQYPWAAWLMSSNQANRIVLERVNYRLVITRTYCAREGKENGKEKACKGALQPLQGSGDGSNQCRYAL